MEKIEYEEILNALKVEIETEIARCDMEINEAEKEGRDNFSNYLGMATLRMMKDLVESRNMAQYRKTFNMIESGDSKAVRRFANGSSKN